MRRIFGDGVSAVSAWNNGRDRRLPRSGIARKVFGSWDGFLEWMGLIEKYATYHCGCGLHTSDRSVYSNHARTCYVFRQQMMNELERISKVTGLDTSTGEWERLKKSEYPSSRVISKVWRSWGHFLAELYQREDAKMNRREDGYGNIALPVSSVREDAHRVYYMLR